MRVRVGIRVRVRVRVRVGFSLGVKRTDESKTFGARWNHGKVVDTL